MTRDVCIIAEHGCVAEAGEESRLERVKAIVTRLFAQLLQSLQAAALHLLLPFVVASATETGTFPHAPGQCSRWGNRFLFRYSF